MSRKRDKRRYAKEETQRQENTLQLKIRPKTDGQQDLFDALFDTENQYIAVSGPAGSGKTILATYFAAKEVMANRYERVIICRSVTTIQGEEIGFLSGSAGSKLQPFMVPFMDNFVKFVPRVDKWVAAKKIEVVPLAFIRGRSFENCIVLLDEAQNIDKETFRSIMTRISDSSKLVALGDFRQSDKSIKETDFEKVCKVLEGMESFEWVELTNEDIQRSRHIAMINSLIDEIA